SRFGTTVLLPNGKWALAAADGDGSGGVFVPDYVACRAAAGEAGYLPTDFNLDGRVDSADLFFYFSNQGNFTARP
ncbi:hypothetical protein JW992_16125, partial [candidate division KSB1 bacterium]|nr:hypothetical protein [candidate division KSB1 bacterium]